MSEQEQIQLIKSVLLGIVTLIHVVLLYTRASHHIDLFCNLLAVANCLLLAYCWMDLNR